MFTARKLLVLSSFLILATLGAVAPAYSSPVLLHLTGVRPGYTDVGYGGNTYVFPYTFSIDGQGGIDLMCDDFNDEVYLNESWHANVFSIADVADAGNGQMTPVSGALGYDANAADHGRKQSYRSAAYLFKQLVLTPSYSREDAVVMNHAVWSLFASNTPFNPNATLNTSYGLKSVSDMLAEADAATRNLSDRQMSRQFEAVRFYTPVCTPSCDNQPAYASRPQEFIGLTGSTETNAVPEASSVVLMTAGLMGMGVLRRRSF